MRDAVRAGDVCVRLGGDEFVVLCTEDAGRTARPTMVAERLFRRMNTPYDVHGHEVIAGGSIGVATAPGEDPVSIDQLLSNADVATTAPSAWVGGASRCSTTTCGEAHAGAQHAARVGGCSTSRACRCSCSPIARLGAGGVVGFDCSLDWESAGLHDAAAIAEVVEEAGMHARPTSRSCAPCSYASRTGRAAARRDRPRPERDSRELRAVSPVLPDSSATS